MFNKKAAEQPHSLADQAAESANQAIKSTQRVANDALDSLTGSVQDLRQQASVLAHRGVDSVRDTSQQLRDKALRASDNTLNYIKDEPIKSVLIAAATGAALMALVSMMASSRDRR